jgi:hypothetical protein
VGHKQSDAHALRGHPHEAPQQRIRVAPNAATVMQQIEGIDAHMK